jgi:hypothetical protein
MIRNIQDLENIDTPSSSTINNLQEQILNLKENLFSLNQLVENIQNLPSSISTLTDQCCLRTYCQHTSNQRLTPMIDSPSSSGSSLDQEKTSLTTFNRTIPGFIRNPVSNFLMPTKPTINEIGSSSIDDNMSSDDEQSINSKIGSMVVMRDDDLWIYPIGVNVRKSKSKFQGYNRSISLFDSINETNDLFIRRKSFDDEDFSRKNSEKLQVQFKKYKKGKGVEKVDLSNAGMFSTDQSFFECGLCS